MPDRAATPEELLDLWLDALNEPGRAGPPPAPDEIDAVAAIALDYRRVLGIASATTPARPERNGKMHHGLPLASPNGASWKIVARQKPARTGWVGGASNWLATAVVIGLLIALAGGVFVNRNGLPGGADDPTSAPGVAASPESTPDGALSCGAPGYRPVVEGEVNADALAAIDIGESPIVLGEDAVTTVMTNGDELTVPRGDASYVRGNAMITEREGNSITVTRITDGEQWELPSAGETTYGNDRYVITPTDESLTNLAILDVETGEQTTAADILGAPFALPIDLRFDFWTDDSGSVFTMYVKADPAGTADDPPTPEFPGVLVIPGSLSDAYFISLASDTMVTPDGELLISVNEVFESQSGERLYHNGEPVRFDGIPVGFADDVEHLLVIDNGRVREIDLTTGSGQDVFVPEDDARIVGHSRTERAIVVGVGAGAPETWIWVDLATGEHKPLPELDGYELSRTSAGQPTRTLDRIAQFIESSDPGSWNVRGLDMTTGKVSGALQHHVSEDREWIVLSPYLEEGDYLVSQDIAGNITVLEPATDMRVELGFPAEAEPLARGNYSQRTMLSPSGTCIVFTVQSEESIASFVTPIVPGGDWTRLPFAITEWVEIEDTDPRTLPALDVATPVASPEVGSGLSCASPGYVPIVYGDPGVDLSAIGGNAILATDDGVTVPLPNGEIRELPPGSDIGWNGNLALTIHDDNSATFTRLSDGETWDFPSVMPRVWDENWDFFDNGRYAIGPADDSRNDWIIVDTLTGDTRMTSDILGEPFKGRLDPFMMSSSEDGSLWVIQFMHVSIVGEEEDLPPEGVEPPGYLVIPGSLDDAWFSDRWRDELAASPGGTSFITNQVVRDPFSGERVDSGDDNLTYFGELIGYLDESTLLTFRQNEVQTVDIETAATETVYTAVGDIVDAAWDREANTLAVGAGPPDSLSWALVHLDTGEATALPDLAGYRLNWLALAGGAREVDGVADLVRIPDSDNPQGVSTRALEMRTGVVSDAVATRRPGEAVERESYVVHADSGQVIARDTSGQVSLIDPASNTIAQLGMPDGVDQWSDDSSLIVSPNGGCAVFTLLDGQGNPDGPSWVAPLEPGATWTRLNYAITRWVETDDLAGAVAASEPEVATPAATPEVAEETEPLTCASPGYRPLVTGPDALALLIGGGEPIVRDGETTITAANGTEITLGADEQWLPYFYPGASIILTGKAVEDPDTVTSLVTGESWPFPDLIPDPPGPGSRFYVDRTWLILPKDGTATDWHVIDTTTGEERLTSEIFGAAFAEPHSTATIGGPWAFDGATPAIIGFHADDGGDMAALVLPSSDLDDAWALDPANLPAAMSGVITADGTRIAYLDLQSGNRVRVLDGYTGNEVATWPGPETDDTFQTVGLTGDDSKLVLRDNQTVWTVDLASGEIATVFDPGGDIHELEFDNATGNLLASSGDGQEARYVWIDPATGEVEPLDIPAPMRVPHPQAGWALIMTRDEFAVDYSLLDMATGEIVTEPITASREENGSNAWITGSDETGVYVVQAESGRLLVLGGPEGDAFELSTPGDGRQGWEGIAIGVSPNAECLVYTEVNRVGDEPGTSWIAPLDPDATWTELPFELGGWWEFPEAPDETDPATPSAFVPDWQVAPQVRINLRQGPSAASEIVATLLPGTPLDYLDEDAPTDSPSDGERWLKLATEDGQIGWIRELDLEPYAEATATQTPQPTTTPLAIEPIDATETPDAVERDSTETTGPTTTPMSIVQPIGPLPDTPEPGSTEVPDALAGLPGSAIPVVEVDEPEAVDQDVVVTVRGIGPSPEPGITIPLRTGEPLELPDAIGISQLPLTTVVVVENVDGTRVSIDLTTGETLANNLTPATDDDRLVGHYLLTPGRDGTIWRIVDLLSGEGSDTATIGGGPFDRPVTVVPMPTPLDAPRHIVVQFAFETSPGELAPWQGLATETGPPSGTLVIPGAIDDARFLDTTLYATIDTADPTHPTVALSGRDRTLLAQVTRLSNGRIMVVDALTGDAVTSWRTFRAWEATEVFLAGFGPEGTSLVAWLTSPFTDRPDQVIWLRWDGGAPVSEEVDIEGGTIQEVIPAGDKVFVAVLAEPDGDLGPATRWKLLDLESGELTDLPDLDGAVLDRHVPGGEWAVFDTFGAPGTTITLIVETSTGEVVARLDDPDLGTSTARSPSRDFGVIVITGHTGDDASTGYVIDATSGESWRIAPPVGGQVFYSVSPDGSVLTALTDTETWVAPVAADTQWERMPAGRIVDWLWLPDRV